MKQTRSIRFGLVATLVAVSACGPQAEAEGAASPASEVAAAVFVDSVFPIEEEIRRFRATLDEAPERLSDAAASRDELVRVYVEALEAGDTERLRRLRLTRAEFAYLYYPRTRYTVPPYELSPALVWFQMENYGGKGFNRMLGRYGGQPLGYTGYRCDQAADVEGENRIWQRCVIERATPDGRTESLPILGPILERDGRFKFISYANGL